MPDADEISVEDEAYLFRRIHPEQIVKDQNSGLCRPSSAAFKNPELSVDAEPLLHAQGLDWRSSLRDNRTYSLVRFHAGTAREVGQEVVHKPVEGNEAHCEVIGKKTPSVAKALSAASEWVRIGEKGTGADDCGIPAGVATEYE